MLHSYFNPRSRVGNDVRGTGTDCITGGFQSTFPRGERQKSGRGYSRVCYFNPRSRVGNDNQGTGQYRVWFYFNPRSRVGNDRLIKNLVKDCRISIHVPAWGTTSWLSTRCLFSIISIHVPAWGTTVFSTISGGERLHFNPRSRVGNDETELCEFLKGLQFQSTFPRGERQQIFTNILCFFMQ